MFEGLFSKILQSVLSKYFETDGRTNPVDFTASLWSGFVVLDDLKLRPEVLNEKLKKVGVRCVRCGIRRLELRVPWAKIGSRMSVRRSPDPRSNLNLAGDQDSNANGHGSFEGDLSSGQIVVVIDGMYILLSTLKEEANVNSKSTSTESNINQYNHNNDLTYQNNNNHNRNIRNQINRRRAQLRGDGLRGKEESTKEDEENSSRTTYLSSIFRQMLGFDDPSSILFDFVERMELHIRDFHIRLEDCGISDPNEPFACGLTLESFHIQKSLPSSASSASLNSSSLHMNKNGKDHNPQPQRQHFKSIQMNHMGLYWNSIIDIETFGDAITASSYFRSKYKIAPSFSVMSKIQDSKTLCDSMMLCIGRRSSSSSSNMSISTPTYLVNPIDANCFLQLHTPSSSSSTNNNNPNLQISITIQLGNVEIDIRQSQYDQFRPFFNHMQRHQQQQRSNLNINYPLNTSDHSHPTQSTVAATSNAVTENNYSVIRVMYGKHRPTISIRDNSRIWWKYVLYVVRMQLRDQYTAFSWHRFSEASILRKRYIHLYKCKILSTLQENNSNTEWTIQEQQELQDMEDGISSNNSCMDVKCLLVYRAAVERQWLAENPHSKGIGMDIVKLKANRSMVTNALYYIKSFISLDDVESKEEYNRMMTLVLQQRQHEDYNNDEDEDHDHESNPRSISVSAVIDFTKSCNISFSASSSSTSSSSMSSSSSLFSVYYDRISSPHHSFLILSVHGLRLSCHLNHSDGIVLDVTVQSFAADEIRSDSSQHRLIQREYIEDEHSDVSMPLLSLELQIHPKDRTRHYDLKNNGNNKESSSSNHHDYSIQGRMDKLRLILSPSMECYALFQSVFFSSSPSNQNQDNNTNNLTSSSSLNDPTDFWNAIKFASINTMKAASAKFLAKAKIASMEHKNVHVNVSMIAPLLEIRKSSSNRTDNDDHRVALELDLGHITFQTRRLAGVAEDVRGAAKGLDDVIISTPPTHHIHNQHQAHGGGGGLPTPSLFPMTPPIHPHSNSYHSPSSKVDPFFLTGGTSIASDSRRRTSVTGFSRRISSSVRSISASTMLDEFTLGDNHNKSLSKNKYLTRAHRRRSMQLWQENFYDVFALEMSNINACIVITPSSSSLLNNNNNNHKDSDDNESHNNHDSGSKDDNSSFSSKEDGKIHHHRMTILSKCTMKVSIDKCVIPLDHTLSKIKVQCMIQDCLKITLSNDIVKHLECILGSWKNRYKYQPTNVRAPVPFLPASTSLGTFSNVSTSDTSATHEAEVDEDSDDDDDESIEGEEDEDDFYDAHDEFVSLDNVNWDDDEDWEDAHEDSIHAGRGYWNKDENEGDGYHTSFPSSVGVEAGTSAGYVLHDDGTVSISQSLSQSYSNHPRHSSSSTVPSIPNSNINMPRRKFSIGNNNNNASESTLLAALNEHDDPHHHNQDGSGNDDDASEHAMSQISDDSFQSAISIGDQYDLIYALSEDIDRATSELSLYEEELSKCKQKRRKIQFQLEISRIQAEKRALHRAYSSVLSQLAEAKHLQYHEKLQGDSNDNANTHPHSHTNGDVDKEVAMRARLLLHSRSSRKISEDLGAETTTSHNLTKSLNHDKLFASVSLHQLEIQFHLEDEYEGQDHDHPRSNSYSCNNNNDYEEEGYHDGKNTNTVTLHFQFNQFKIWMHHREFDTRVSLTLGSLLFKEQVYSTHLPFPDGIKSDEFILILGEGTSRFVSALRTGTVLSSFRNLSTPTNINNSSESNNECFFRSIFEIRHRRDVITRTKSRDVRCKVSIANFEASFERLSIVRIIDIVASFQRLRVKSCDDISGEVVTVSSSSHTGAATSRRQQEEVEAETKDNHNFLTPSRDIVDLILGDFTHELLSHLQLDVQCKSIRFKLYDIKRSHVFSIASKNLRWRTERFLSVVQHRNRSQVEAQMDNLQIFDTSEDQMLPIQLFGKADVSDAIFYMRVRTQLFNVEEKEEPKQQEKSCNAHIPGCGGWVVEDKSDAKTEVKLKSIEKLIWKAHVVCNVNAPVVFCNTSSYRSCMDVVRDVLPHFSSSSQQDDQQHVHDQQEDAHTVPLVRSYSYIPLRWRCDIQTNHVRVTLPLIKKHPHNNHNEKSNEYEYQQEDDSCTITTSIKSLHINAQRYAKIIGIAEISLYARDMSITSSVHGPLFYPVSCDAIFRLHLPSVKALLFVEDEWCYLTLPECSHWNVPPPIYTDTSLDTSSSSHHPRSCCMVLSRIHVSLTAEAIIDLVHTLDATKRMLSSCSSCDESINANIHSNDPITSLSFTDDNNNETRHSFSLQLTCQEIYVTLEQNQFQFDNIQFISNDDGLLTVDGIHVWNLIDSSSNDDVPHNIRVMSCTSPSCVHGEDTSHAFVLKGFRSMVLNATIDHLQIVSIPSVAIDMIQFISKFNLGDEDLMTRSKNKIKSSNNKNYKEEDKEDPNHEPHALERLWTKIGHQPIVFSLKTRSLSINVPVLNATSQVLDANNSGSDDPFGVISVRCGIQISFHASLHDMIQDTKAIKMLFDNTHASKDAMYVWREALMDAQSNCNYNHRLSVCRLMLDVRDMQILRTYMIASQKNAHGHGDDDQERTCHYKVHSFIYQSITPLNGEQQVISPFQFKCNISATSASAIHQSNHPRDYNTATTTSSVNNDHLSSKMGMAFNVNIDVSVVDVLVYIKQSREGINEAYRSSILPVLQYLRSNRSVTSNDEKFDTNRSHPNQNDNNYNTNKNHENHSRHLQQIIRQGVLSASIKVAGFQVTLVPGGATLLTESPTMKVSINDICAGGTLASMPSADVSSIQQHSGFISSIRNRGGRGDVTKASLSKRTVLMLSGWISCEVSSHYHNRRLVSWEPFIEKWVLHGRVGINVSQLLKLPTIYWYGGDDDNSNNNRQRTATDGMDYSAKGRVREIGRRLMASYSQQRGSTTVSSSSSKSEKQSHSLITRSDVALLLLHLVAPVSLRKSYYQPPSSSSFNDNSSNSNGKGNINQIALLLRHTREKEWLHFHGYPVEFSAGIVTEDAPSIIASLEDARPLNINVTGALFENLLIVTQQGEKNDDTNNEYAAPHRIRNESGQVIYFLEMLDAVRSKRGEHSEEQSLADGCEMALYLKRGTAQTCDPHKAFIQVRVGPYHCWEEDEEDTKETSIFRPLERVPVDAVGLYEFPLLPMHDKDVMDSVQTLLVRVELIKGIKIVTIESPLLIQNITKNKLYCAVETNDGKLMWDATLVPLSKDNPGDKDSRKGRSCVAVPCGLVRNSSFVKVVAFGTSSCTSALPNNTKPQLNTSAVIPFRRLYQRHDKVEGIIRTMSYSLDVQLPSRNESTNVDLEACLMRLGTPEQMMILFRPILIFKNFLPLPLQIQVRLNKSHLQRINKNISSSSLRSLESMAIDDEWKDIGIIGSGEMKRWSETASRDAFDLRVKPVQDSNGSRITAFPYWSDPISIVNGNFVLSDDETSVPMYEGQGNPLERMNQVKNDKVHRTSCLISDAIGTSLELSMAVDMQFDNSKCGSQHIHSTKQLSRMLDPASRVIAVFVPYWIISQTCDDVDTQLEFIAEHDSMLGFGWNHTVAGQQRPHTLPSKVSSSSSFVSSFTNTRYDKRLEHPTCRTLGFDDIDIIMHGHSKSRRLKVCNVKKDHEQTNLMSLQRWSNAFSTEVVGSVSQYHDVTIRKETSLFVSPFSGNDVELSLSARVVNAPTGLGGGFGTTLVHISNRYQLVNCLDRDLEVAPFTSFSSMFSSKFRSQRKNQSLVIPADSQAALHFNDLDPIRIRPIEYGWSWSGLFHIRSKKQNELTMRLRNRLTDATIIVTIHFHSNVPAPGQTIIFRLTKYPPYRIENHSTIPLKLYQHESQRKGLIRALPVVMSLLTSPFFMSSPTHTYEDFLLPYQVTSYAWDDAEGHEHMLVIQVANLDEGSSDPILGRFVLDSLIPGSVIHLSTVKRKKLLLEVSSDGPTRVFKIVDTSVPRAVLQMNNLFVTSSALKISFKHGIGISVIDWQPQELCHIFFNGFVLTRMLSSGSDDVTISVDSIVFDNQIWATPYPVLLRIGPRIDLMNTTSIARINNACAQSMPNKRSLDSKSAVYISFSKLRSRGKKIEDLVIFRKASISVAPISLNLDGVLVRRVVRMVFEAFNLQKEQEVSRKNTASGILIDCLKIDKYSYIKSSYPIATSLSSISCNVHHTFVADDHSQGDQRKKDIYGDSSALSKQMPLKMYIEDLQISPLNVLFSFTGQLSEFLNLPLAFEGAPLFFRPYSMRHAYGTVNDFCRELALHYINWRRLMDLVLNIFLNPVFMIPASWRTMRQIYSSYFQRLADSAKARHHWLSVASQRVKKTPESTRLFPTLKFICSNTLHLFASFSAQPFLGMLGIFESTASHFASIVGVDEGNLLLEDSIRSRPPRLFASQEGKDLLVEYTEGKNSGKALLSRIRKGKYLVEGFVYHCSVVDSSTLFLGNNSQKRARSSVAMMTFCRLLLLRTGSSSNIFQEELNINLDCISLVEMERNVFSGCSMDKEVGGSRQIAYGEEEEWAFIDKYDRVIVWYFSKLSNNLPHKSSEMDNRNYLTGGFDVLERKELNWAAGDPIAMTFVNELRMIKPDIQFRL